VKAIREARKLSVRDLSALLADLGRPILASGISKIEQGQRRVDTDELIALAIALGVTPSSLLLPPVADDSPAELAATVNVPSSKAWRWADGQEPLKDPYDDDDNADFQLTARPKGARRYHSAP
jgi:transcriptional regulator with XRE-family HTH domain